MREISDFIIKIADERQRVSQLPIFILIFGIFKVKLIKKN